MTSSHLPSSATSSPSRVRFNPELASPSSGRPRRSSVPYPKVAQCKDIPDRKCSFDLCWKLDSLSAVEHIIPIRNADGAEHANKVPVPEDSKANASPTSMKILSAIPMTPSKLRRQHQWIVVGRERKEAILKSNDPKDIRLREYLLP